MPNRTDLTTPWMSMRRHPRILAAVTILSAGLALSACKLKNAEPGPLTGPSVLGTSLTITATPNALTKDGRSTSTIVITARGPNIVNVFRIRPRETAYVGYEFDKH